MVAKARQPFHVMTKPIGPRCNLDCDYCFYLRKAALFEGSRDFRMPLDRLERYIQAYIEAQPGGVVSFAWQGGEPTLLGLDYFREIVRLQARYAAGRRIENALQTNGTLLDEEWCVFLRENDFLVGISIDGPRVLHDQFRLDRGRRPTFDRVMRGLRLLREGGVAFNTLTVVNRENSRRPLDVYRFLKECGSGFIQFIPLVEPMEGPAGTVSPASVRADRWGGFLCAIFDEWLARDVGRVHVQTFEAALGIWAGAGPGMCVFAERCGRALAVEHTGEVFSCDHYVAPEHRLGNFEQVPLADLVDCAAQEAFGRRKRDALPEACLSCPVLFACQGECPKNRVALTPSGQPGLNHLCAGYREFFLHADPALQTMADLIRFGRPAWEIRTIPRNQWRGRIPEAGRAVSGTAIGSSRR